MAPLGCFVAVSKHVRALWHRPGEGPPDKAPWAAPGSVCGPEGHPGFYQQSRVQQAADTLLPRLVRHWQELRGPDDRRQPVSRRGEKRVRQTVHCPVPLPTRQAGGHVQGKDRLSLCARDMLAGFMKAPLT